MSSFLCFICHSTVNAEISEETRDKYREIVGMNLCPDSQLCHICCHVLNKLSLFRCICLKRSLEYPVLFSEKGTINLQKTNIELLEIPCSDNPCNQYQGSTKTFQFTHNSHDSFSPSNCGTANQNQYVALEDDNQFKGYFNPELDYPVDDVQDQKHPDEELIRENEERKSVVDDYVNNYDDFYYKDELHGFNDMTDHKEGGTYCNDRVVDGNDSNDKVTDGNDSNDKIGDGNDLYDKVSDENDLDDKVVDGNDSNEEYKHDDENNDMNSNCSVDDNDIHESAVVNEMDTLVKKEGNRRKKRRVKKVVLSVEEQKAVLEAQRKEKKYLDAEFKCYNCALPFLFKDTYQAHMMRHEESNGEYLCPICTLRFASPAGLRAHAKVHARGGVAEPRPAHRATCHLCGHQLKDSNGLQQHLRRVHMAKGNRLYSCSVCGESFPSQPALRTHMIKHIKRKFPCTECPAVYSSPYTLTQHRRRHAAATAERHECAACGNAYDSRKSLLAHWRTAAKHQQSASECPMCGRMCPNQRSLSLHVQAMHSSTKDHACPHCTARYSTRRSLLRHVASHTHKPQPAIAVCHLCGSSFKGQSKLNRHLKNVCEKAKLEDQLASLYE